jgi:transposase
MFELWVGIDWGSENHQVCLWEGGKCEQSSIKHEGEAIAAWVERLVERAKGKIERIAAAIETPHCAVVETLVGRGIAVFSINPKQLDRFRDRHTIAGAKDDRRDAFVLADSLRTDQSCFRRIQLGSKMVLLLRELSRIHDELVAETTALSSRVSSLLLRYYPSVRSLAATHPEPWLWDLLELCSMPSQAKHLSLAKVKHILQKHRIKRLTAQEVLDAFRAPALRVADGIAEACSTHLVQVLCRLRVAYQQRVEGIRHMAQLQEQMRNSESTSEQEKTEHRDAAILLSVPGIGTVIGAVLLAEGWQSLRERDYPRLRALCGVAPITKQSGKRRDVVMRYACNSRLRNAVHHWASVNLQHDPTTRLHYTQLRAKGHSYGRALRGVADRLLNVAIAMLRHGTLYDPTRRQVPEKTPEEEKAVN